MERSLKIIYISLLLLVVPLELFFALFLLAIGRAVEFFLINIGAFIIVFFVTFFLQWTVKRVQALKIFVREILWILVFVFGFTSYGVFNVAGISATNILSLVGPTSLLGASFLAFQLAVNALFRIRRWQNIGIRSTELTVLLGKVDTALQGKEHEEISWAYKNARYLILLFVTEQLNLILILISDIFEKLINETFKALNEPIPKDEKGEPVGWVKKANHLKLNLTLDETDFNLRRFWSFRSKYVHGAIEKTVEIVPPEEEIEKSIMLLSKTLREYPAIVSDFR